MSIPPFEADRPLIIDADAPLTCPIPSQPFQTVSWWTGQFFDPFHTVNLPQLAKCRSFNGREPAAVFALVQFFRFPVRERPDHSLSVARLTRDDKRFSSTPDTVPPAPSARTDPAPRAASAPQNDSPAPSCRKPPDASPARRAPVRTSIPGCRTLCSLRSYFLFPCPWSLSAL